MQNDTFIMFDRAIVKYQIRDAALYWIVIPAAVIVAGKSADLLFGLPPLPYPSLRYLMAFLLLIFGLLFIWLSTRHLTATGGTPNPLRPPRKLVTSGVYSFCRHPMFFGYDCCALAVVLFLGSAGMLCGSFPVFLFLEIRFLQKEEKILLLKFKDTFRAYKDRTPFLLPLQLLSKHGAEKS